MYDYVYLVVWLWVNCYDLPTTLVPNNTQCKYHHFYFFNVSEDALRFFFSNILLYDYLINVFVYGLIEAKTKRKLI